MQPLKFERVGFIEKQEEALTDRFLKQIEHLNPDRSTIKEDDEYIYVFCSNGWARCEKEIENDEDLI